MALITDLLEGIKEISDLTMKKADKLYWITKLKLSRAQLKELLAEQYMELGRLVYFMKKGGGENPTEINALAAQIDGTRRRIAAVDRRLQDIMELVRCPRCHSIIKIKNTYCSRCGKKIAEEEESVVENENQMNIPNQE